MGEQKGSEYDYIIPQLMQGAPALAGGMWARLVWAYNGFMGTNYDEQNPMLGTLHQTFNQFLDAVDASGETMNEYNAIIMIIETVALIHGSRPPWGNFVFN